MGRGRVVSDFGVTAAPQSLCQRESEQLPAGWLRHRVGEWGPLRNISPRVHLLPAPHSPLGFVRSRSPKEESRVRDCLSSPPTRSALAPGPPSSVPSLWPCFLGLGDPPPLPHPRSQPHSVCACRPLQPLLPLTWLWDPVPAQTLLPAPLGAPDPVRGRHVEPLAPGPSHARL